MSAEKTGLNRLVRRLASRQDHQVLPADRLTGHGKALRSDRQVSIERPEHSDLAGYVTQDSTHTSSHVRFLSVMQRGHTSHHTTPQREAALLPVLTAGRRRLVRLAAVRQASTRTSMASGPGLLGASDHLDTPLLAGQRPHPDPLVPVGAQRHPG